MLITDAVILGGGLGKRYLNSTDGLYSSTLPKQFQLLGESPVFIHGLKALISTKAFRHFILVFPKEHLAVAQSQVERHIVLKHQKAIRFVVGGKRRQESSRLAIRAIEDFGDAPTRIVIHDACRPFLSPSLLSRVKKCLNDRAYAAWIPTIPVVETLKKITNRQVEETIDRNGIFRIQTPQVFEYSVIRSLVDKGEKSPEIEFTDDASLCEFYGIPVGSIQGDERNIKLTYGFEMEMLRALLRERVTPIEEMACEPGLDTISTD